MAKKPAPTAMYMMSDIVRPSGWGAPKNTRPFASKSREPHMKSSGCRGVAHIICVNFGGGKASQIIGGPGKSGGSAGNDQPIELQLTIGKDRIDLGRLELHQPGVDANWTYIYRAIQVLQCICVAAMRTDIRLTIANVCRAVGNPDLTGACHIRPLFFLTVFASDWHMRLELQPTEEAPPSFDSLLGYSLADVGQFSFGAVVERPIQKDVLIDCKRHIDFGAAKLIEAFIGPDESTVKKRLEVAYEKHLNRQNTDAVLAVGDYRAFIATANSGQDICVDRPHRVHAS